MKGRFVSEHGNLYDNFQMLGYVEGTASPFDAVAREFFRPAVAGFPSCGRTWSICGPSDYRTTHSRPGHHYGEVRAGVHRHSLRRALGRHIKEMTPSSLNCRWGRIVTGSDAGAVSRRQNCRPQAGEVGAEPLGEGAAVGAVEHEAGALLDPILGEFRGLVVHQRGTCRAPRTCR